MIKKILLAFSLLIGFTTLAQQETASPYSFYGTGEETFGGTNEYKAMGGVNVYSDSIHINLKNPASFSKLKFTTFTVGATDKLTKIIGDNNTSSIKNKISIDYLAIGLPLGKFGTSFGVLPFSSKGYSINTDVVVGDQKRSKEFKASGGLNKAFAGVSYSILPNLQIGADLNYYFGNIYQNSTVFIKDDGTGFFIPKGSRERNETHYSGFSFNTGLIYTYNFEDYDWHNSFTFTPESKLSTNSKVFLETVSLTPSGGLITNETNEIEDNKGNIVLPSKFTLGTGFGKNQKWFVGIEYTQKQNRKLNNSLKNTENVKYQNSNKVSIGGFYIPKYNSFNNYLDRVIYRGGLRYENTGLLIDKRSIDDKAISIGAGFPISNGFTNLNINLEFGQKGLKSKTLVKENYLNLSIGLSLNDSWFNVRRFE